MTMTTTSTAAPAKPQPKPSGLYTVPLGSTEPLRKGVAKVQFKPTTPVMKKLADFMLNRVNGLWNSRVASHVHAALAAKGGKNIRLPSGNFYANSNGQIRSTPAPGYQWYQRKGYDPKTGIAWVWVVVS